MPDIKLYKSTKLFYNEYPFKISYQRLYGWPNPDIARFGYEIMNEDSWWFRNIPKTDEEKQRRKNCVMYLSKFENVKFMNSAFTHVYFKDRSSYEKAQRRYKDLQTEHHEPILENLSEVIGKFKANVDLKKTLFHKHYRYKVTLRFNSNLENSVGPTIYELYHDNPNYKLNTNVFKFGPGNIPQVVHTTLGASFTGTFQYQWRHSPYHTYAVYCREKIDMEMLTFVASENISKITKAVLIDEIDK